MAVSEPFHIKHTLPPSFRAWYQLLRRTQESLKRDPAEEAKIIVWYETHPAGLRQGYEFTLDEIKARAFDELIEGLKNLDNNISTAAGPWAREGALNEMHRFLKHKYLNENNTL